MIARFALLAVALGVTTVLNVLGSSSAIADGCGTSAGTAGGAVWVSTECGEPGGQPVNPPVSSGPTLPTEEIRELSCMASVLIESFAADCLYPDNVDGAMPPAEAMNALMLEAVRRVAPPAVEVIVQPPGGRTLVNLDTIFLAEAESVTRPVRLLGREVLLQIMPSRFTWVHGDGSRQVTDQPGRPYAQGVSMDRLVTHRYSDAGTTVHPRVDVGYSARYSLDGGATWRDVVGVVTIQGPTSDLEVVEAQPVLVGTS